MGFHNPAQGGSARVQGALPPWVNPPQPSPTLKVVASLIPRGPTPVCGFALSRPPQNGIALAVTMSKGLSRERHDQPGAHGLPQAPTNQATLTAVVSASPCERIRSRSPAFLARVSRAPCTALSQFARRLRRFNAEAQRLTAWQHRNRTARSVWSAWSLLPLSDRPAPHDSASKLDALQTLRAAVHPQEPAQLAKQLDYCRAQTHREFFFFAFLCDPLRLCVKPGSASAWPHRAP